jgi:hypothetical protein
MNDASPADARAIVDQLVRRHNLLLVIIVVFDLACAMAASALRLFDRVSHLAWIAGVVAAALPFLALIVTGIVTRMAIVQCARQQAAGANPGAALAVAFRRSKNASMIALTVAACLAGLCLLIVNRRWMLAVVALPLILMLLTRPGLNGLITMASLVEAERGDSTPASETTNP